MFKQTGVVLILLTMMIASSCNQKTSKVDLAPQTVIFRLAEYFPSDYPTTLADIEFARLVKEKTEGRIEIIIYENGQLGTEKSVLQQVQFGAIDFARVSISPLADISPQLNVLHLPYIYRDEEHMWKVLNSHIGAFFLSSIEEQGFIGLCYYDAGVRSFYNSVQEIKTMSDLKGLKFRVQESQLMVDMIKAMGASFVPMPFEDVYQSIQKGEIDGAENNYPSYETSLQYEVAKYYTVDKHVRVPEILVASEKIKDRISEEDLEIIKQCALATQDYQREKWVEKQKESEEIVRASGCIITEIEDVSEFIEAVKPLYTEYAADYMDIVKEIQSME